MRIAEIDDEESDSESHEAAARPVKRARKVVTNGAWLLVLIVTSACGPLFSPPTDLFAVHTARTLRPGHILGVLLTRWEFVHSLPESAAWLQRAALRQGRDAQQVHGFLQYPVAHFAKLVQPIAYGSLHQSLDDMHSMMAMEYDRSTDSYSHEAELHTILKAWQLTHSLKRFSCVMLQCSQSLSAALLAGLAIFHAVVLSGRINRKRLLKPSDPSRKTLGRLRGLAATSDGPCHAPIVRRKPQPSQRLLAYTVMHKADMLIECLGASKYVKAFGYMWAASKAFSRIFAKSGKQPAEIPGATAKVDAETLRGARMRLDVVCMSLFRMLWRMLSSSVCVFLYLDSSPQAEGVELFAVSFELWALDGSVPFMRRLMPVIRLPRNFWDASGKLVALLWCIWLLVGPRPDDVLRFVMSIRSITTDMGTETL